MFRGNNRFKAQTNINKYLKKQLNKKTIEHNLQNN